MNFLDELLGKPQTEEFVPTGIENIYMFFAEHGISLKEVNELPIPYLINCYLTAAYQNEQLNKKSASKKQLPTDGFN